MEAVTLIFPNQLFKNHPSITIGRRVILVEEWLFFRQYKFHKLKLVLHRASMMAYKAYLENKGHQVSYIDTISKLNDVRHLIAHLAQKENVKNIHFADVTDNWLLGRITTAAKKHKIEINCSKTPTFLNTMDDVNSYFDQKKTYFQTDFYIWQRKSRNILLEPDGKPIGGKWSFDQDNRKPFHKNEIIPIIKTPIQNQFVKEAILYIETNFNENYGSCENFFYPTTFKEAEHWLADFFKERFRNFGIYEDAMVASENFLYHGVLTPMLNIGLLTPGQVIDKALENAANEDIPLNSLEGFIRQIMGWREFIRIIYEREGSKQRTKNYWNFKRKIPSTFWSGNTGIGPIDMLINKILKTGYSHHIERLMVLGNFMLLCEFHPDEVYKWFMEMYIDSYDWVMVPNVYGMTQFADGGLMTTKPYISGSNYLNKMGNWSKACPDPAWQQIWDGLFWRFMHTHRKFFLQNPRLGMLVGTFDKMSLDKQAVHLNNAEKYLKQLDHT